MKGHKGAKGGFQAQMGKGGPQAWKGQQWAPVQQKRLSQGQLQEKIHHIIYNMASAAVAAIAGLDPSWDEASITPRIVKYFYKASCDAELYTMPWQKMVGELVARCMHGYSAACAESDWFFSIDMPPVFYAVAWEILGNNGQMVGEEELYEAVTIEYEDKLDRILLDRAMWESAKGTVGQVLDEKSITKVFHGLSKCYNAALDEAFSVNIKEDIWQGGYLTPEQELARIETFMKKWIDDSMCRCWNAIDNAESLLTLDNTEMLFRTLIAPFGEEDPFSCIPQDFFWTVGRPQNDWPFISDVLQQLFAQWGGQASSKRRRKGGGEAEAVAWTPAPRAVAAKKAAPKAIGGGNPQCTSESDCIGTAEDGLVQHMLNGEGGDIYCVQCWQSFQKRNPQLEGVNL